MQDKFIPNSSSSTPAVAAPAVPDTSTLTEERNNFRVRRTPVAVGVMYFMHASYM